MGKKKVHEVECDCGATIRGFSEHHAKQNLMIHQKTSIKCQEFKELLRRKWPKR